MAGKVLTGKDIERILLIAQDVISLNTRVSNDPDSEAELFDYLEDPDPTPDEIVIREDRKAQIMNVLLKNLNPREAKVIILRFGLETDNPMTLEEVGRELGITRERVRQIEERTLRKLRYHFIKNDITIILNFSHQTIIKI